MINHNQQRYSGYDLIDGKPNDRASSLPDGTDRAKADEDGLWVPLTKEHHTSGKISAHQCKEMRVLLEMLAQVSYERDPLCGRHGQRCSTGSVPEKIREVVLMKEFTIRGRFFGDKTFPSLNNYLAEVGRNPKAGGRLKRQYVMLATNAIRRDLKRWKASAPVILHYTFAERKKGAKRDRGNIFGLADKFIEVALRDCA